MNWSVLPPLAGLRAFAAFAETGNVVQAGLALGVSHAAVSQQLRGLEAHLGISLLNRQGRAMVLTPEGAQLAQAARAGFSQIAEAVESLTGASAVRPVHVTCTPGFAASWLLPRLPGFREKWPDVGLTVDPSTENRELGAGGVDLAIRYGAGGWSGLECHALFAAPLVVVAAPTLLAGRDIRSADDLVDLPWLEELGTTEATRWLVQNGVRERSTRGTTQMPGSLLLDSARDGQGVMVIARVFVARDIAAGRLRVLFTEEGPPRSYHLVTRLGAQRAPVQAFCRWLRQEARQMPVV